MSHKEALFYQVHELEMKFTIINSQKCLRKDAVLLYFYSFSPVFPKEKGRSKLLLAQHLSGGRHFPRPPPVHVREFRKNRGARGRCNREGAMLHQLVNMSLGCSCGNQEQKQEAGDVGGREEGGRERSGRDEGVHARTTFIPVMRRALSNQGQAYKSDHN